ncbi:MAG TPA: TraB/GumN family protein [Phycisphaerae bacterium]|nr:TraB/GumN family protein [Phycisphaerae bacterium]
MATFVKRPHPRHLAAALLLLAVPALADAPATQTAKRPGFMWKVTSPTTTAYLVGSIHAASEDMYPLPTEMEQAFKDASILVVELDITKVNQLAVSMQALDLGTYKNGDTLDEHVPAETMEQIRTFCKDNGLPESALSVMKPWMAGLTMAGVAMTKAGLDPGKGIDEHFLEEDQGKKVVELESADSQIQMLSTLTDAEQVSFLKMSNDDMKNMAGELKDLAAAWKSGDEKSMLKLLDESYDTDKNAKSVGEKLVYSRNAAMAEKITGLLKGDDKVFVVVGAAHLLGDRGIVALLQKQGFKVERVPMTLPPPPPPQPASAPATSPAP